MEEQDTGQQPVVVDHGDLLEAIQAAEAWAGYLRQRAVRVRNELGALPIAIEDSLRYEKAADRIDQAINRLSRDGMHNQLKPNFVYERGT